MNKQQLKTIVMDIVREEMRKGELVEGVSVLDKLPKTVDAVEVDKEYLYDCVRKAFENSNPVNSVLGIFGLRIIRENDAEKLIWDEKSGEQLTNALKINKREFEKAVSEIAGELSAIEKENSARNTFQVGKINELVKKLEKEQEKLAGKRRDYEMTIRIIADRMQFLLGMIGEENMEDPMAAQLQELLADLGMKALWKEDKESVSEGVMFQILKTKDPSGHKNKPCIAQEGRVISQGVIFIEDSAEKEEITEDNNER